MFVPIIPHSSSASQELGQKILQLIQDYQRTHPDLSGMDIRSALRTAEWGSSAGDARRKIRFLTLGLVVIGGALAVFLQTSRRGHHYEMPLMPLILILIVAGAMAVLMVARR